MKRLLLLAALMTAACQPMPATESGVKSDLAEVGQTRAPVADSASLDATECAARGGKMLPQGRMQTMRCVIRYADAGQRCTDGDDCDGDCRVEEAEGMPHAGSAVVGQCQVNSSRFGCYTTVEDGKAEPTICVD